jgi:hypothetical protein
MSTLRPALADYLALRQAMGFKMHDALRLLSQFVDFLTCQGATFIPTEWALCWATQPRHVQPAEWATRLRLVRGFAQYQCAIDPRTEVPSPDLFPGRPQRHTPYLYSDAEITQLIEAASRLPSATGLRADTYTAVFGLLVVTGMRISELVGLDNDDVDLVGGLLITGCKFSGVQTLLAWGNERDTRRKMRGILSQLVGRPCASPPYVWARILLRYKPRNILLSRLNSSSYGYCQNLQPVNRKVSVPPACAGTSPSSA